MVEILEIVRVRVRVQYFFFPVDFKVVPRGLFFPPFVRLCYAMERTLIVNLDIGVGPLGQHGL